MDEKSKEWQKKLIGKTLFQNDAETDLDVDKIVRLKALPKGYRVMTPDSRLTRDRIATRLTVEVDQDFRITYVYYG